MALDSAQPFAQYLFFQHDVLGGLQYAIEATQDGERKNNLAVLGLLVIATQQIGNKPDEG